jgi:hypothetical protein
MLSNLFSNIGGALQQLTPIAQQMTQNQQEQDIYNVMDASQALPLITQRRQQQMFQGELQREQSQRDALRKLAEKGIDLNNPTDYFRQAASITGDTTALDRYLTQTMGGNSPAAIQLANEMQKARAAGDEVRMRDLANFSKIFDKGVYETPQGGIAVMGAQGMGTPAGVGYNPAAMPMQEDMSALPQLNDAMFNQQYPTMPAPMPSASGVGALGGDYGSVTAGLTGQKAAATERAKLQEQLGLKPQIAAAEKNAVFMEEGRQALPKIERSLQDAKRSSANIGRITQQVREKAKGAFTTGFTGSIADAVPGSPAFDLKENLKTLRANAAFDTLQNMRNNSPTGGALGAISEMELQLLESAYSNLNNSQSREQFEQNLSAFEQQHQSAVAAMEKAYMEDYQRFGGASDPILPPPAQMQPSAPVQPVSPPTGAPPATRLRFNPATGTFE